MRLRKVDTVPESGLGFHIPSLITYGVNFLILLAILYAVGFKPILNMLNNRAETIRESLETADKVREEAARNREELEGQMAESREQGQQLMAEARAAAERVREEQQDRARAEADALIERAREDINQERDRVINEVRRNFADLAILAAERVVQQSIDRDAHGAIIDQVLEDSNKSQ